MRFFILLSLFLFSAQALYAQNEVMRELSSLAGISEFGVVINIEKPADLESENLSPSVIRDGIIRNFDDLPVNILNDATLRQSDEFPILHIHVNVMKASNGTYPFAIEMNFYQPVKLILNRDLQSMASTWNKGQIGIVSEDKLSLIGEQAIYAGNVFKDEFVRMN